MHWLIVLVVLFVRQTSVTSASNFFDGNKSVLILFFFLSVFYFMWFLVHPLIQVPNMLVGAPLGVDITLVCNVEASPKAINYWQRENGEFITETFYIYCHKIRKKNITISIIPVCLKQHFYPLIKNLHTKSF